MLSEVTLSRKNISGIGGTLRNLCSIPQRQTGECTATIGQVSQHAPEFKSLACKRRRSATKWPLALYWKHQLPICKHRMLLESLIAKVTEHPAVSESTSDYRRTTSMPQQVPVGVVMITATNRSRCPSERERHVIPTVKLESNAGSRAPDVASMAKRALGFLMLDLN